MTVEGLPKVLLLEDGRDLGRAVRELLRRARSDECESVHVKSLAEAPGYLRQESAWVILLDLGLPGNSGVASLTGLLEAAQQLLASASRSRSADEGLV